MKDIITDAEHISNVFNKYYTNLGQSLANKIPNHALSESTMPDISQPQSFFFVPTTPEEVIKVIQIMKPKTSCGFDQINSKILKKSNMIISIPLPHIINLSVSNGTVPSNMKIAKVIPVYKANENNLIKNYRPISLLPSFSKILEKLVYKRLYSYFQQNKLLCDMQYGFRKNLSTELAILDFKSKIIKIIQNKKHCLGIFLDLSKAFDTLQHNILLKKSLWNKRNIK